jgi:hypothetical protein
VCTVSWIKAQLNEMEMLGGPDEMKNRTMCRSVSQHNPVAPWMMMNLASGGYLFSVNDSNQVLFRVRSMLKGCKMMTATHTPSNLIYLSFSLILSLGMAKPTTGSCHEK